MDIVITGTKNLNKWADKLEELGQDTAAMRVVGYIYRDYINVFAPKGETGELRDSARVYPEHNMAYIDWDPPGGGAEKYVCYQYHGEVYGPNKAVFGQGPNLTSKVAGVHAGWVSPKKPKTPTGRMMGEKATITLHDGRVIKINGYTTQGTGPYWIDKFMGSELNKKANIIAGRYIYEKYCELVGETPVGGFRQDHWDSLYG